MQKLSFLPSFRGRPSILSYQLNTIAAYPEPGDRDPLQGGEQREGVPGPAGRGRGLLDESEGGHLQGGGVGGLSVGQLQQGEHRGGGRQGRLPSGRDSLFELHISRYLI